MLESILVKKHVISNFDEQIEEEAVKTVKII